MDAHLLFLPFFPCFGPDFRGCGGFFDRLRLGLFGDFLDWRLTDLGIFDRILDPDFGPRFGSHFWVHFWVHF